MTCIIKRAEVILQALKDDNRLRATGSHEDLSRTLRHNDHYIASWLGRNFLDTAVVRLNDSGSAVAAFQATAEITVVLLMGNSVSDADEQGMRASLLHLATAVDPTIFFAIARSSSMQTVRMASRLKVWDLLLGVYGLCDALQQEVVLSRHSDKFKKTIPWDPSKTAKSNKIGAMVRKTDVPREIRTVVLHNSWMRFFLLIGGPEVKEHHHRIHARE
eukprot:SAG31_NODE_10112_length_1181_cov_1.142329_1_plen_216_part_10